MARIKKSEMSRKIPPEEYMKYGKFIEDEGQYDCRTIDRVLEIIDKAQTYKMAVGSTDLFIDREAFREEVLALKGEQK